MRIAATECRYEKRLDRVRLKVRENATQLRIKFNAHVKIIDQFFDNLLPASARDQISRGPQPRRVGRQATTMFVDDGKLGFSTLSEIRHGISRFDRTRLECPGINYYKSRCIRTKLCADVTNIELAPC